MSDSHQYVLIDTSFYDQKIEKDNESYIMLYSRGGALAVHLMLSYSNNTRKMNTGGVMHSEFDVNGNGEIAPLPSPPKKYTLEAEADKITNLPGFRSKSNVSTTNSTSTSSLDELPYNQFSGYLNISPTKKDILLVCRKIKPSKQQRF